MSASHQPQQLQEKLTVIDSSLFLTVGGSHQPLVTAINFIKPARVVFFCTDRDPATGVPGSRTQIEGQGLCIKAHPRDEKPTLPNIPAQCGLSDTSWHVVLVPADDFDQCFRAMRNSLAGVEHSSASRKADYTGGTKTMTAALVAAALETEGVELRLVTGVRADLARVSQGTETSMPAAVARSRFDRQVSGALSHWSRYDYAAAVQSLSQMSAPMDGEHRAQWQQALCLSRAFAAWDCFDHEAARAMLDPFCTRVASQMGLRWTALKLLAGEPCEKRTALQLWDLYLNAQRCGDRGRWDDATARLYRLLEWMAQHTLERQKGWQTGDVPADIAAQAQIAPGPRGRFQVGLHGAWQLVRDYCEGPEQRFIAQEEQHMLDHIKRRNHSILAHGYQPVRAQEWQDFWCWFQKEPSRILQHMLTSSGFKTPFTQLPVTWLWSAPEDRA